MAQTPTAFDTTVLVDLNSDNGMKYKMPRHGPHTPWSPIRNRIETETMLVDRRPRATLRTPTTRWPATCSRGRPRHYYAERQACGMTSFTNDLSHTSGHDFWKIWRSKFDYNTNDILQVDGTSNSAVIVENFAKHFEKVCRPSSRARNDEFKPLFIKKRSIYNELLVGTDDVFSVEVISDNVIKINKKLAIANRSRVSCAHNMSRASMINP